MKHLALRLFPLLIISLCGCLKMEHKIDIEANGTCRYELEYSISENAVVQIMAMNKLKAELQKAQGTEDVSTSSDPLIEAFMDPNDDMIRAEMKRFDDYGVTLKELKVETKRGWRDVTLKLETANLARAAEAPFFKTHGFDIFPEGAKSQYVFSRAAHIEAKNKALSTLNKQEEKELTPLLAGFRTKVKITVPGRIINSTAFETTLRTASWTFDFDRDANALMALQRQPFRIVFERLHGVDVAPVSYAGSRYPSTTK